MESQAETIASAKSLSIPWIIQGTARKRPNYHSSLVCQGEREWQEMKMGENL
jgi:hypothetical protein